MAQDWKERLGVVYSTNPDFKFEKPAEEIQQTLPPEKQNLKIMLDRKHRKGKTVTLIDGYVGTEEDINSLAKFLKTKCGAGGSAKDGQIIIQGDFCMKIIEILNKEGYKTKKVGG